VDHLAPATRIRALREPAAPVRNGLLEDFVLFLLGERDPAATSAFDLPQHEHRRLPATQGEFGDRRATALLQRHLRRQTKAQARGAEARAFVRDLGLVLFTGVVEGRGTLHPEAHLAAHHPGPPDDLMVSVPVLGDAHGHVVDDLADTVRREEARYEDVRVGPVELLACGSLCRGRYLEASALLVVEDGGEDARGVEMGGAQPVY
jgi:hypothetical protein